MIARLDLPILREILSKSHRQSAQVIQSKVFMSDLSSRVLVDKQTFHTRQRSLTTKFFTLIILL